MDVCDMYFILDTLATLHVWQSVTGYDDYKDS